MKRIYLVAVILVAVSLACAIQVATPMPTVFPTVALTATRLLTVLPLAATSSWTAQVKQPTVNVREKPAGRVISALTVGQTVTILSCDGAWCLIDKPVYGWVFRGCLDDNPEQRGCEAK